MTKARQTEVNVLRAEVERLQCYNEIDKAELGGLRAELAAANDSIERSKDYECELRAEVERLRDSASLSGSEVIILRARIAELERKL